MFKAADTDGDGEISLDEFKTIMRAGPDTKPDNGLVGGIKGGIGGATNLVGGAVGGAADLAKKGGGPGNTGLDRNAFRSDKGDIPDISEDEIRRSRRRELGEARLLGPNAPAPGSLQALEGQQEVPATFQRRRPRFNTGPPVASAASSASSDDGSAAEDVFRQAKSDSKKLRRSGSCSMIPF